MNRKNVFLLIVMIILMVGTALISIKATRDYMIFNAEPDFIEHTIEWNGQIYLYE